MKSRSIAGVAAAAAAAAAAVADKLEVATPVVDCTTDVAAVDEVDNGAWLNAAAGDVPLGA
jgi:hypothetical protein